MTKYYTPEEKQAAKKVQRHARYLKEKERAIERQRKYYEEHKEHERERERNRARLKGMMNGQGTWKVVQDPDPEIAIARNAELSAVETDRGLMFGTFTPDTILAYKDTQFRVIGEVGCRQRLESL